jgi:hypothetical protein
MRCKAKKRDGSRCKDPGVIDGKWCRRHNPNKKTPQFTNRASCSVPSADPSTVFIGALGEIIRRLIRAEMKNFFKEIM